MILNDDDVNDLLNIFFKKTTVTAYAIKINGKYFRTDKARMTWVNKSAASLALRNSLEFWVMQQIELKLKEQGYTRSEIYNHDEYKNAWPNFRKYLEDNNLLEFIELK